MVKPKIIANFNKAAANYDNHALLQEKIATALDNFLSSQPLPRFSKIVEIGCGTGFLTEKLAHRFPQAQTLITDIALAMVRATYLKRGSMSSCLYAVMDGEAPAFGSVDLIAANLVFQWFQDFPRAFALLLQQTKVLAFSTLLEGTFSEWRALCVSHGLPVGLLPFPSLEKITALVPQEYCIAALAFEERQIFTQPITFLRSLKRIGAHHPCQNYRPSSLHRALTSAPEPFEVTSHVGLVCITHPSLQTEPHP